MTHSTFGLKIIRTTGADTGFNVKGASKNIDNHVGSEYTWASTGYLQCAPTRRDSRGTLASSSKLRYVEAMFEGAQASSWPRDQFMSDVLPGRRV
jgi:hypothetical protein